MQPETKKEIKLHGNQPHSNQAQGNDVKRRAKGAADVVRAPVKTWRDGTRRSPAPQQKISAPAFIYGRNMRSMLAKEGNPTDWSVADDQVEGADSLVFDWGCDVAAAPVSWLWAGRIPRGSLTLLAAADPGPASLVAIDLAARLSRNASWPDAQIGSGQPTVGSHLHSGEGIHDGPGSRDPAVMYFATPQARAAHAVPGLQQAGADLQNVLCLDGVVSLNGRQNKGCLRPLWRPLRLPHDTGALRHAIRAQTTVQLLVLDPLEAFIDRLGGSRAVQQAAEALQTLAWDFGLAVVGITRLRHAAGSRRDVPLIENKILAEAAASASGVVTSSHADRQYLLFPVQCTLGEPGPALTFDVAAGPEPGSIRWNPEPLAMTAADFSDKQNAGIKFAIGAAWLRGLLSGGPRPKQEVQQRALELGMSANMLRNVQAELGIKARRSGFPASCIIPL